MEAKEIDIIHNKIRKYLGFKITRRVIYLEEIDMERLRKDMVKYYGTAIFNGFPVTVMKLGEIEHASENELIKIALDEGIDLKKYMI